MSGQFTLQLAQERRRDSTKLPKKNHRECVRAYSPRSISRKRCGTTAEARSLSAQMLVTMRRIYGDDHQLMLSIMAGLAVVHNRLGDTGSVIQL